MNQENSSSNPEADWQAAASDLLRLGDFQGALDIYARQLENSPNDTIAMTGLGHCFEGLGRTSAAIKAYKIALRNNLYALDTLLPLGRLCLQVGKYGQAEKFLSRAVETDKQLAGVWADLGAAQRLLNKTDQALKSLKTATGLDPSLTQAKHNLALTLQDIGQTDEAVHLLEAILSGDEPSPFACAALASIRADDGRVDEALALLDRHLSAFPEEAVCHQCRALILLKHGRLSDGFSSYEWRFSPTQNAVPQRPFTQPQWQGETLEHEKLLIWSEQGIGDEILAASMVSDILKRAPQCLIECDPRLTDLLARSFPSAQVIAREDPPVSTSHEAGLMCPALSAAQFLRADWADFPTQKGYLNPDPAKVKTLRKNYDALAKGRKIVGLSWASNGRGSRLKTPPLESWRPLLQTEGVLFVGLQFAPHAQDIASLNQLALSPLYFDESIDAENDLDATAAQISVLDGVISISNSTAHLAGAVGVPTATVVAEGQGCFWYWHRDRDDSPWYPSMRICRQKTPGHWTSAMAQASDWLRHVLDGADLLPEDVP